MEEAKRTSVLTDRGLHERERKETIERMLRGGGTLQRSVHSNPQRCKPFAARPHY